MKKYRLYLLGNEGFYDKVPGQPRNIVSALWYSLRFPFTKQARSFRGVLIREISDWGD